MPIRFRPRSNAVHAGCRAARMQRGSCRGLPGPVVVFAVLACLLLAVEPALAVCERTGVQLQILGSGGPGASAGRASAGYLVWIDGVGRILVDAGGGIKQRFHASGADLGDVALLALSHLHPDHAAAVPALLWPRGATLRVAGPSGSGLFPSLDDWLTGLFGPQGVFRVLAGRLDLDPVTVDVTGGAVEVWRDGDVRVTGIGVPHGGVPAVGYRMDAGDASVAFSSDQNGSDPAFIEFVRNVDVLVVHLGRAEDATGRSVELHASPSGWGALAAEAGVGRVVASHISTSSPRVLADSLGYLRESYGGPLTVGEDLLCVAVP